ncbi:MAG: hypothetical protein K2H18_05660 [Muribaculaceae bacterium]|nr:hypothetical protein [Muribaculaceae bacterium]
MITMIKSDEMPVFSVIKNDSRYKKITPVLTPTELGKVIYEQLEKWENENPQIKILRRVVMPDHIHFEVYVRQRLPAHLGSLIAVFKKNCSQAWADSVELKSSSNELKAASVELSAASNELKAGSVVLRSKSIDSAVEGRKVIGVFKPGFNDKIAFKRGAKDAFYNYIADNPRRYLIKKLMPEYFYHKVMIKIEGKNYGLYGNITLLDEPCKAWVKISRKKVNTPDLEKRIRNWEETIRCGGVLVSPFINPEEKIYRDKAIENGAGLIIIVDYLFSERRKPYKELFNLCGEGRLLIVSSEKYSSPQQKITYPEAQVLNGIAEAISSLAPRRAKLIKRPEIDKPE